MRKFLLLALLAFAPIALPAQQIPATIAIKTTQTATNLTFTITWSTVAGQPTFDVLTFSNPRMFATEELRVVTGQTWSVTVPRAGLPDSLQFYASVRASNTPRYGAITYRNVPAAPTKITVTQSTAAKKGKPQL